MKKIRMAILLLAMVALLTVSSVAGNATLGSISISYGVSGGLGGATAYTSASFSSHITAGISSAAFFNGTEIIRDLVGGTSNVAGAYASYSSSCPSDYYAYSVSSTHSYYYTAEGLWNGTDEFYQEDMGFPSSVEYFSDSITTYFTE